jgi:putative transposase
MRVISYCLMSNHFHLILWPRKDGDLRRFMQWLTVTHTRRWHAHHHKVGQGALYQGRYKSFPVQRGIHLLKVARYVERNALRAGLVQPAEKWEYCSLHRRGQAKPPEWLLPQQQWPASRPPANWVERVNEPENKLELESLRRCVKRGQLYGEAKWQGSTAQTLSLESSLRDPWRPKRRKEGEDGKRK